MPLRWIALLLLLAAGCNRQDTECLTRIGRKLAAHARTGTGEVGNKIDLSWAAKREPSLQDKIQDRLRFENTLTEVTFEVRVNGKEIDLKGSVKTALQRQRAIELAETVAGVEKVNADILVREAE
jgi:osmotically-inducible protein OsmY